MSFTALTTTGTIPDPNQKKEILTENVGMVFIEWNAGAKCREKSTLPWDLKSLYVFIFIFILFVFGRIYLQIL